MMIRASRNLITAAAGRVDMRVFAFMIWRISALALAIGALAALGAIL